MQKSLLCLGGFLKKTSDLNDGFMFPGHIALSTLRSDIVIFSDLLKRVILVEP